MTVGARRTSAITALLFLFAGGWGEGGAFASSGNPLPALTGAPSENLCVDCHAGALPNSGPGNLTVEAPAYYVPGREYVIRIRLGQAGGLRWGFQITALSDLHQAAGVLVTADTAVTQSQTEPSLARTYINHRSAGTFAGTPNGPVEWQVRWRAPLPGTGAVTFYAAGNAANGNGDPTGDAVYTTTFRALPSNLLDTLRFLSFPAESLVTKKAEKRRPANSLWRAAFVNRTGGEVSRLEVRFNGPVVLTRYVPFPEAFTFDGGETWIISGQTILHGDTLVVEGSGPRGGTEVSAWRFGDGLEQPGFTPAGQLFVAPMPNPANVRSDVFSYGGFGPWTSESDGIGGLVVGRSFLRYQNFKWRVDLDSARVYGWARIRSQSALQRSLAYGRDQRRHVGDPRGFCSFDNGRPFTHQTYLLPPTRIDNRLVAEIIALKVNIAASQLGITPAGFGELEYVDPGHPLDGYLVREISTITDSFLTRCSTTPPAHYDMVDTVLRKINGAFAGGIDTISFSSWLEIKGVRPVNEVLFLRPSADAEVIRLPRLYHPEYDEGEEEEEAEEDAAVVPEVVQLLQNYPNPFNPSTTIRFELQEASLVTLSVYDMLGREIVRLLEGEYLAEGTNEAEFLADDLATGVYFYRLTAEAVEDPGRLSRAAGKMVLVR